MVLTHHVPDDSGAFTCRAIRLQSHLLHRVQNATMDRLQSVANIGQSAPDDDGHRIVEIRTTHLFFDIDRLNVESARAAAFAGWWSQWEFWILRIVRHGEILAPELCLSNTMQIIAIKGVSQPNNNSFYHTKGGTWSFRSGSDNWQTRHFHIAIK